MVCNIGTSPTSTKWLSLDICGLGCSFLSYFCHLFALHTIYTALISSSTFATWVFYILYVPCSILALASLFQAQHTDPGAVPIGARPLRVEKVENDDASEISDKSSLLQNMDGIDVSQAIRNGLDAEMEEKNVMGLEDGEELSHVSLAEEEGSKTGASVNSRISTMSNGNNVENGLDRVSRPIVRMKGIKVCKACKFNYKPVRSHHDSVTGRCICKFDHFCPWVGNAVGALNHKFFILFIFYTFLTSGISLFLIVERFVRCGYTIEIPNDEVTRGSAENKDPDISDVKNVIWGDTFEQQYKGDGGDPSERMLADDDDTNRTFMFDGCTDIYSMKVLILLIMSFCFLIFTCCMLFEQVEAIENNVSKIAQWKMKQGANPEEYAKVGKGYNEIFGVGIGSKGSHIGLHWFLPLPVQFPSEREKERVLGFEYSEKWGNLIYEEGMIEEDEYDEEQGFVMPPNKCVEIELPATRRGLQRNGTISKRSYSKLETDASENSSHHIV